MKPAQTQERAAWEAVKRAAGSFGQIDRLLADLERAADGCHARWEGPADEPITWLGAAIHLYLDHADDDRDAALINHLGWLARRDFSPHYHDEDDAPTGGETAAPAA